MEVKHRILIAVLHLNGILFTRGCDHSGATLHTPGILIPFAEVEADIQIGAAVLPSSIREFSVSFLIFTLAAGALIGIALFKYLVPYRAWKALWITTAIANSVLLLREFWCWAVFFPTSRLAEFLDHHIVSRPRGSPPPDDLVDILWDVSSRL